MSELNVFATTFNLATNAASLTDKEIRQWLEPALKNDQEVKADIIVIGIQEMSPLHVSMSGLSTSLVTTLSSRFLQTLNSSTGSFYKLSDSSLCSIGLWVFFNEATVPRQALGKVSYSATGLGTGGTGNKGAVGVRIAINRGAGGAAARWETFTFVSSHLAAHDHALKTRNANYETILTSLIFPPAGALDVPSRLFHTSHCILLGDLNYRLGERVTSLEHRVAGDAKTQQKNPRRWEAIKEGTLAVEASQNGEVDKRLLEQRRSLVEMDTLAQQRDLNKTMLGLREGPLTSFAPTYKRLMGKVEGYDPKRRPGYTDRILFASHDDELVNSANDNESSENDSSNLIGVRVTGRTKAVAYCSIPEMTISDHKPVYTLINIPPPVSERLSASMGSTPFQTPFLPFPYNVPSASDPLMLASYNGVGRLVDKIIGISWLTTLVLGGGKVPVGLAVEAVLLTILLVWWKGFWPF